MSCECYKIGGKFIAEDPDCPAHGVEARKERSRIEQAMDLLEETVHRQEKEIRRLSEVIGQMGRNP